MTRDKLDRILYDHKKWLNREGGKRANLAGEDMQGIDLKNVDLRCAYMHMANLQGATLFNANLNGACLSHANLQDADLTEARLSCADLSHADLGKANLWGADLHHTKMNFSNLQTARMECANLHKADLTSANLFLTRMANSILTDAVLDQCKDIETAKDFPYISMACPTEGAFIGWKKVSNHLIKLEIPADARRSSAATNKCRCDKAKVLSCTNIKTGEKIEEIRNSLIIPIIYKVGEVVCADSFDECRWNDCTHGIHFFVDKQAAINYKY